MNLNFPLKKKVALLALGAESAGLFAYYQNGQIYLSDNFGDLTEETNFSQFKKSIAFLIKKSPPDFILTDLHPLYNPTLYGETLGKKLKIPVFKIQHHLAHIFSVAGENHLNEFIGLAGDGTGYGWDGKIWGGEIFKIQNLKSEIRIERIGHLEEQPMLGGDSAVLSPPKMLLGILSKFLEKKYLKKIMKRFFSGQEFELLSAQLQANFNCPLTTSIGRILDAASALLGFCSQRTSPGQPAIILEKNSTQPYSIKPIITDHQLLTTPLFEYLLKNLHRDKKKLAATVHLYLAQGLLEMARIHQTSQSKKLPILFSGGVAYNKIISSYLIKRGVKVNRLLPRGDENISFGQIIYYLTNPGN